jgi:hypothetical protein
LEGVVPALLYAPYFGELRKGEVQHSPVPIGPGDAGDDEITPPSRRGIRRSLVYADTETVQAERLGEGLGHRDGVLRGLIQDPANGLRGIPLPRTPVNKGKRKAGDPRGGPRHIMESDFA